MVPFYLTQEKGDRAIFRVASTEHDEILNCKNYQIIKEIDNIHRNTFNVKAKKIGENMVYLGIDETYLINTSEIFAIVAQEISMINLGNVIPTSMSQNGNTAIVFFGHR